MRILFFFFCLANSFSDVAAQKTCVSMNGRISFVSTRNDDVAAVNRKVTVTINDSGAINFKLLIQEFDFKMSEMESHFNEEYLESDKYPAASFIGQIVGVKKLDFGKPGIHNVRVSGNLTIHNVTKKITVDGIVQIEINAVTVKAKFPIDIDHYKIRTGIGGVMIGDKMMVEVMARCI